MWSSSLSKSSSEVFRASPLRPKLHLYPVGWVAREREVPVDKQVRFGFCENAAEKANGAYAR